LIRNDDVLVQSGTKIDLIKFGVELTQILFLKQKGINNLERITLPLIQSTLARKF
jgi:hypothetical protein